ncbi:MAG: membrane protein insertion efficiency factor YidD [Candidatus Omnitrophica bacterium]|nr:membrane protein insertion efficiency factor YidD [Candidatus Omnitrophota bacterium]MCM8791398.1 membrane protein insertion efficiency factor YidD [Candidatus Omnitrophota bacterium]
MRKVIIEAIKFYRNYLSCMNIQCCRFYPSCSEYAIEALQKYGVVKGLFKSIGRITRCHPFCKGGYDPA